MDTEPKTPLQVAVRILIILGVIILLFLLSFTIIRFVPRAFTGLSTIRTSLSGLFSKVLSKEKITISSEPASYNSGDVGVITWIQTGGNKDGYYTFQYDCNDSGIIIEKTEDQSKGSYSAIECGKPYVVGQATTTSTSTYNVLTTNKLPIRVSFSKTKESFQKITISHRKSESGDLYSENSLVLNVNTKSEENTATTTTSSNNYQPPAPAPAPVIPAPTYIPPPTPTPVQNYGPADLTVRISQVGSLDAYNRFISGNYGNPNNRVAIKFQVTNIGQGPSGVWKFTANLPAYNPNEQIYYSGLQSSIPPGKTSYFTIGFYGMLRGPNQIRIFVDPDNRVLESNEENNVGSI